MTAEYKIIGDVAGIKIRTVYKSGVAVKNDID